jgi:hypothetical protein
VSTYLIYRTLVGFLMGLTMQSKGITLKTWQFWAIITLMALYALPEK